MNRWPVLIRISIRFQCFRLNIADLPAFESKLLSDRTVGRNTIARDSESASLSPVVSIHWHNRLTSALSAGDSGECSASRLCWLSAWVVAQSWHSVGLTVSAVVMWAHIMCALWLRLRSANREPEHSVSSNWANYKKSIAPYCIAYIALLHQQSVSSQLNFRAITLKWTCFKIKHNSGLCLCSWIRNSAS